MKKILLGLLLVVSFYSNAQEIKKEINDTIKFNKSKDEVFTNILIWTAETFNDSNNVIKLNDKNLGIIVLKGMELADGFSTSFTISFRFKDSSCVVSIKDWKETEYNYNYGDISNCRTNACRKNVEKWTLFVDKLEEKFLNIIKEKISN